MEYSHRNTLIGIGSLSTDGNVLFDTGTFSSISVDQTVSVNDGE